MDPSDAISLSSDSEPETETDPSLSSAFLSTKASNLARASINNYGQPVVSGPGPNRPLTLPVQLRQEVDLTQGQAHIDRRVEMARQQDPDEDEDEELKRAIALSLESHQEEILRDAEGAHHEDVKSDNEHQRAPVAGAHEAVPPEATAPKTSTKAEGPLGFLGLDRKAMEAERLARLKRKRDAEADPFPTTNVPSTAFNTQTAAEPHPTTGLGSKRPKAADKRGTDLTTGMRSISPPIINRRERSSGSSPVKPAQPAKSAKTMAETTGSTTSPSQPQYYPHGKIFKTHSPAHATTTTITTTTSSSSSPSTPSNTITFPALLGDPSSITSALLSSFTIDFDWLLPHFSTATTNFVFVLHTHSGPHRAELRAGFEGIPNVRLVFPAARGGMLGHGTMHSKLMVLFYKGVAAAAAEEKDNDDDDDDGRWAHGRCRVVVPTGNLVPHDWGVGSVMENLVFVIDLPMLAPAPGGGGGDHDDDDAQGKDAQPPTQARKKQQTPFERGLFAFLTAQDVPVKVLWKLASVDFTKTEGLAFVSSVAGFHVDASGTTTSSTGSTSTDVDERDGTGLWGLSAAVRELGLQCPASGGAATATPEEQVQVQVQVDYATSSLGALTPEYVSRLYSAIRGVEMGKKENLKLKKVVRMPWSSSSKEADQQQQQPWRNNLRIYFPSSDTVQASRGGPDGAGTICFQEKWWDKADFPREVVRDAVSVREGLLGHSKFILVRYADQGGNDYLRISDGAAVGVNATQGAMGWVYVGSANCSESAWYVLSVFFLASPSPSDCVFRYGRISMSIKRCFLTLRGMWKSSPTLSGPRRPSVKQLGSLFLGKVFFVATQEECSLPTLSSGSSELTDYTRGRAGPPVRSDNSTRSSAKLTMRNWECGVIIRVPASKASAAKDRRQGRKHFDQVGSDDVFAEFQDIVPITIRMPGESMVATRRLPWFTSGFGNE
ncbi:uncharacterized protein HMPREF1541_09439 [Cyphellophora europaea CBS 101466]|uniref:PLD phosphodiesterase domain-containing protein n=1 Tax=Cyphellophora europaea (strain CBS 101466) TaxID=1220924 RepID=W2SA84_CYPE1|nr:uncharacterized protein HMPREF1541_09439 [Cyphellophora europaea CBS 101466]ETN45607.1 hypothetical protein HMPREF1541_09439 [Cyphellophora europaea CBS 101466]